MTTDGEKFTALLEDLHQLAAYLHRRGDKTLKLSQQFAENARKDTSNKGYDLRQAYMVCRVFSDFTK